MAIMMEDLFAPVSVLARPGRDTEEADQNGRRKRSMELADLELFQRALSQQNDDDWYELFERFQSLVFTWIHHHPQGDLAALYHAPDSYVALAFERFWLAAAQDQSLTFSTLGAALSYLKASLNGAILDTLRVYARPEVSLPEQYAEELVLGETTSGWDLWEVVKDLFPTPQEQRLAYLLLHCGLKPRYLVQFCPDEFPQVGEVYRFRHNMMARLLRHADLIRWRLSDEG